jgi:hypothetical protein
MREDANFDRLIDSALSAYAKADPKLEQRILAHISAEPVLPHHRRLFWAFAPPAAACLALLFLIFGSKLRREPSEQKSPSTALSRPGVDTYHAPSTSSNALRTRRPRPVSLRLPKQEVFPVPQPLSSDERLLEDFATRATNSEGRSILQSQEQFDKPIQISAIHIDAIRIPPLESPSAGSN